MVTLKQDQKLQADIRKKNYCFAHVSLSMRSQKPYDGSLIIAQKH